MEKKKQQNVQTQFYHDAVIVIWGSVCLTSAQGEKNNVDRQTAVLLTKTLAVTFDNSAILRLI